MKLSIVAPGVLEYSRKAGKGTITFRAENIRSQATGIHAKLLMFFNTTMLVGSVFNIERDEDRNRLNNAAHKMLGPDRDAIIDKAHLKHELDLFAFAVWPTLLNADDVDDSEVDPMVPITYLAKPHILGDGAGTIVYGARGSLKSYTMILLGVVVDAGLNGFWETAQHNTLLVNLERPANTIKRRIGCVNSALGLDPHRRLMRLNRPGTSLVVLEPLLRRIIEEREIGFLIIDSLSRTGVGDLNENRPANETMDMLNSLGPSWAAVAHAPRSDESHVFGSTMFENAADLVVHLTSEKIEDRAGVHLQVTKANDIAFPPPMTLAFTFDEFGAKEIRHAGEGEFTLGLETKGTAEDSIYSYLLDEKGKATATMIARELGISRGHIAYILNTDDRFVVVEQIGREKFYGVIRR